MLLSYSTFPTTFVRDYRSTWCGCNMDPRDPLIFQRSKELSQKRIQESSRTGRALCWSLYCVCTIGSIRREIFRWMLLQSQPGVCRMQGYSWCSESYRRYSPKWRSGLEWEAKDLAIHWRLSLRRLLKTCKHRQIMLVVSSVENLQSILIGWLV